MIETKENPFARDAGTEFQVGGATLIEAPEFTHLSPTSDTPFMASLRIEYVPRQLILVGDSVSTFLIGFRDAPLEPEDAVRRVTHELAKACNPLMLNVTSNYAPRHGIAVNPQGRFVHPDARDGSRIITPGGPGTVQ